MLACRCAHLLQPAHPPTVHGSHTACRRILGISGAVNGLLKGFTEAWRVAFVVGLLAGGLLLRTLLPTTFEVFPEAYTLPRAVVAGLLVGLGTARGSGCTSGHGICGNARLSLRSFVATCTFMFSGAVTAWLADTAGECRGQQDMVAHSVGMTKEGHALHRRPSCATHGQRALLHVLTLR